MEKVKASAIVWNPMGVAASNEGVGQDLRTEGLLPVDDVSIFLERRISCDANRLVFGRPRYYMDGQRYATLDQAVEAINAMGGR